MIQYIEGSIFDSPAQVIVNTVNTVGVMGKGIALSFKQHYPRMFERYRSACEKHQLTIGKLMLIYEPDHWILLFPTKENWRNPSKYEYIEKGLRKFVDTYSEKNIRSIAFPRLGCGNGALPWDEVKKLMEKYLKNLPIDVYIYLGTYPDEQPEHKQPEKTLSWLKENAKDMSFDGIRDDIQLATTVIPIPLQIREKTYDISYQKGLIFKAQAGDEYFVSEDKFFNIWDRIRKQSVFSVTDSTFEETLVLSLLYHLGYLSKIKLLDEKTGTMNNGYQINEGSDRVYKLREN